MLGEYGELTLFKASPEKFERVAESTLVDSTLPRIPNTPPRPLLKYPCWSAPILSHGLLYVRGDDRLVCMELIPEAQ